MIQSKHCSLTENVCSVYICTTHPIIVWVIEVIVTDDEVSQVDGAQSTLETENKEERACCDVR